MDKKQKVKWVIGGCLSTIVIWTIAGKIAWDWIAPRSFWGAIKFTLVWTLIAFPFNTILGYIVDKSGLEDKEDHITDDWNLEDHNE